MIVRSIKMVAVGAAAGAIAAAAAVVVVTMKRKKRKGRVIPRGVRKDLVRVIEMAGAEVNPAGMVGESILRHALEDMSDKQLISIYAALKVAQAIREAGIDPIQGTVEQIAQYREHFDIVRRGKEGRKGILEWFFSRRMEELHPLLALALKLSA